MSVSNDTSGLWKTQEMESFEIVMCSLHREEGLFWEDCYWILFSLQINSFIISLWTEVALAAGKWQEIILENPKGQGRLLMRKGRIQCGDPDDRGSVKVVLWRADSEKRLWGDTVVLSHTPPPGSLHIYYGNS